MQSVAVGGGWRIAVAFAGVKSTRRAAPLARRGRARPCEEALRTCTCGPSASGAVRREGNHVHFTGGRCSPCFLSASYGACAEAAAERSRELAVAVEKVSREAPSTLLPTVIIAESCCSIGCEGALLSVAFRISFSSTLRAGAG